MSTNYNIINHHTGSILVDGHAGTPGIVFTIGILAILVLLLIIMIVLIVLLVQRFYRSLTGSSERYLMFTLPVKTSTLIASKAVSALIWLALAAVSIVASAFIIIWFSNWVYPQFHIMQAAAEGISISDCVSWIIFNVICAAAFIMRLYAAISIGSQWSTHRAAGSVLAYILLMIVTDIIVFHTTDYEASVGDMIIAVCFAAVFSGITWYC